MLGGLLALLLFLRTRTIYDAVEIFDPLALQLFAPKPQRKSIIELVWRTLRSLYRDGIYDAKVLEACFKQVLGENSDLFCYQHTRTSTKVGVMAAELSNGASVALTNYNSSGETISGGCTCS